MNPYIMYIIPTSIIDPLYGYEKIICILLIALLIIISLFEIKGFTKIIVTIISAIVLAMHYYVLYMLSKFESINILIFFMVESTNNGSALTIDYGQLMIILIIYSWRKEIIMRIKQLIKLVTIFITH